FPSSRFSHPRGPAGQATAATAALLLVPALLHPSPATSVHRGSRSSQRPPAGRAEGSARRWSSTTKLRHVIPLRLPSPIGAPSVSEKRSSTARRLWRGRLLSHPNPVSSRPRRRRSNRRAGVRGPSIDPIPICSEEVGYLSPPASSTRAPTRGWTRSLTGEVDRRRLGYRTRTPPSSCAPLTSSLRPSSSTTTTRPGRVSPEATSSILLSFGIYGNLRSCVVLWSLWI
ncbi:hypothetical protein Zm00014a_009640, partial [Zea mays]